MKHFMTTERKIEVQTTGDWIIFIFMVCVRSSHHIIFTLACMKYLGWIY